MDSKLQDFISERGNFTTDNETEFELPTPIVSSTPKGTSKPLGLSDVFIKLVDASAELKREIACLEKKCMSQFDNITSRLNALECKVDALGGNVSILEATLEDKILKGDPVLKTIDDFNNMMASIEIEETKKRLIKEMGSIGGSSAQSHVSNIMKRCISQEVLRQFTLKGQGKDKGNFSSSPFYACLIGKQLLKL